MTIATTIATKIAHTLTDQAQQAIAAVIRKISEKLRSRPDGSGEVATLDAAITTGEPPAAEALAQILEQLFAVESQFRQEIQALWDSADVNDGVTNAFYGKAD